MSKAKKPSPSALTKAQAHDLVTLDADSLAEVTAVDLGIFDDPELKVLRVMGGYWREISRRALALDRRAAR
jgi:hypothetical protein